MSSVEQTRGHRSLAERIVAARLELEDALRAQGEGDKDLEEWDGGLAKRTLSFYHAEGAPYLDDDGKLHAEPPAEEMAELQRQGLAVPPTILEEVVAEVVPLRKENVVDEIYSERVPAKASRSEKHPQEERPPEKAGIAERTEAALPSTKVKKPLGIGSIEQLAFLALNTVFPGGLKIPVRKEGLADFDVTIDGKEILIDVMGPLADIPALSVWRFTFAFEGEPMMIYGRGVRGDIKIYKLRVLRFVIRAWRAKRKRKRIARLKARDGWGVFDRRRRLDGGHGP